MNELPIIQMVEFVAKEAGGYTWQYNEPPIVVPEKIKAMFEAIDLEPMDSLAGQRQTDWKIILPIFKQMLPKANKKDASILLDMLIVTYAANMGVGIPYIAM